MYRRGDPVVWRRRHLSPLHRVVSPMRACLVGQGSLTYYLQQRFKECFNIELKEHSWVRPMHAEKELLDLRATESALLRKVILKYEETDLVYARTVIPRRSLAGKNKILQRLKAQPIGTILFSDARVVRRWVRYAPIKKEDMLYLGLAIPKSGPAIWARRSLFELNQRPLLITEFFLPALVRLLCKRR